MADVKRPCHTEWDRNWKVVVAGESAKGKEFSSVVHD
jgi:hypothetical protein